MRDFLFMWPTFFKSKSIKLCLYSIQIYLQYFACKKWTLHFCTNKGMAVRRPQAGAEGKSQGNRAYILHVFSYTKMMQPFYMSLSYTVSKRGPKRFPFSSRFYSLSDMGDQRKSATIHEEQRSYHKPCDEVFHGVFMHFYYLEWTESQKDIWMR